MELLVKGVVPNFAGELCHVQLLRWRARRWQHVAWMDGSRCGKPMFTLIGCVLLVCHRHRQHAHPSSASPIPPVPPWPGIAEPERLVEIGNVDMVGPGTSNSMRIHHRPSRTIGTHVQR